MKEELLICEDCEWTGVQEDCIKRFSTFEELELFCPKCYSANILSKELKED
jgi:Zn finger protein HypA/HybF involved in hydrogenase expression